MRKNIWTYRAKLSLWNYRYLMKNRIDKEIRSLIYKKRKTCMSRQRNYKNKWNKRQRLNVNIQNHK